MNINEGIATDAVTVHEGIASNAVATIDKEIATGRCSREGLLRGSGYGYSDFNGTVAEDIATDAVTVHGGIATDAVTVHEEIATGAVTVHEGIASNGVVTINKGIATGRCWQKGLQRGSAYDYRDFNATEWPQGLQRGQ